MNVIAEVTGTTAEALLADAVNRNFPVAIDTKDGDRWVRYPSRFLELRRGKPTVLCLESPIEQQTGRLVRLASARKLVINFSAEDKRYRFACAVIQSGWFLLAGGRKVEGVQVTMPDAVQRLQRRNDFRFQIPLTQVVVVSIWQGGVAARDMAHAGGEPIFLGRLHDLSVGGLCVRLYGRMHPDFGGDELLGLEFKLEPERTLLLDGRVRRRVRLADGSGELAVQFVNLDQTAEGQNAQGILSRQMAEFQQQSARRLRTA